MEPTSIAVFHNITGKYSKEQIWEEVQGMKSDYLSDDWEDEFDDIEEAYEEQGRNAAEHAILNRLINQHGPPEMNEEFCKLFDKLASYYELQTD